MNNTPTKVAIRTKSHRYWKTKAPILLIILLGAWLRFHALAQDVRFAPDEALFSTFARSAALNGDWWFPGALDKPPLTLYLNALSQVFVGNSEFAARLPGTLASVGLMAMMVALIRALYVLHPLTLSPQDGEQSTSKHFLKSPRHVWRGDLGVRLPIYGLILTALAPFAIAFSATAYTDGLMLLFGVLALLLAARNHWGWAGVWLGLAFASKQQALFYMPLILMIGWAIGDLSWRRLGRFLGGISAAVVLVWVWDLARPGTSLFALALANNDPGRLIRANELLPRLQTWLGYGQVLLGPGWLTGLLVIIALAAIGLRIQRVPRQRATTIDLILLMFVIVYGLLHWLVAFNTYDRYLLLMLPPLILLAARGLAMPTHLMVYPLSKRVALRLTSPLHAWRGGRGVRLSEVTNTRWTNYSDKWVQQATFIYMRSIPLVLIVLLALPAKSASEGNEIINQDGQPYQGIDELAAYLNEQPVATVIYDYWLGWELGYYLGQWHDKRLVYYPAPHLLVEDALKLCEIGPRYFPVPATKAVAPWLNALHIAGFMIEPTFINANFVVYQLLPPWAEAAACE